MTMKTYKEQTKEQIEKVLGDVDVDSKHAIWIAMMYLGYRVVIALIVVGGVYFLLDRTGGLLLIKDVFSFVRSIINGTCG